MMSEEDRAQMMKHRAEKKAKMADDTGRSRSLKDGKRELLPFEPDQDTMLEHMTATVSEPNTPKHSLMERCEGLYDSTVSKCNVSWIR